MFRADARSRAAYESFGDVISFDTTNLPYFATEKQFQDSYGIGIFKKFREEFQDSYDVPSATAQTEWYNKLQINS